MRITGGELRGRVVRVPDLPDLRPTASKVRQALFNILGSVEGCAMLDLFAGSGIMALEALSRGAASVTSVESSRRAVRQLQQLRTTLGVETAWRIEQARVETWLKQHDGASFDLIFADPPYAAGYTDRLPALLGASHITAAQLIIEASAKTAPDWPPTWRCTQSRTYGDCVLHFLTPAS